MKPGGQRHSIPFPKPGFNKTSTPKLRRNSVEPIETYPITVRLCSGGQAERKMRDRRYSSNFFLLFPYYYYFFFLNEKEVTKWKVAVGDGGFCLILPSLSTRHRQDVPDRIIVRKQDDRWIAGEAIRVHLRCERIPLGYDDERTSQKTLSLSSTDSRIEIHC